MIKPAHVGAKKLNKAAPTGLLYSYPSRSNFTSRG